MWIFFIKDGFCPCIHQNGGAGGWRKIGPSFPQKGRRRKKKKKKKIKGKKKPSLKKPTVPPIRYTLIVNTKQENYSRKEKSNRPKKGPIARRVEPLFCPIWCRNHFSGKPLNIQTIMIDPSYLCN